MLRRVLMFPAFVVAGGWVGWLWAYGSTSEDPLAPSRLVTVMAVWEVGDEDLCRAFSYRDLLPHLDTLGLRFALTAADIERCRDDFASYDSRPGWPLKLRQNETDYPGYSFEIEGTDPPRSWCTALQETLGIGLKRAIASPRTGRSPT